MVTIITPVFNGQKFLKRYFEQLGALTYKNLEIIIVNDGSEDESASIIKAYADGDPRIRFIDKKINAGVSEARNAALKGVTGDFVFFFDCDDTFEPEIISACLAVVERTTDTVCYNYASVRRSGQICEHKFSYTKHEYGKKSKFELLSNSFGTSIDDLKQYLSGKRGMREGKELNGPWRIMYSSAVIREADLVFNRNLRVGEDTVFTNEYLARCETVKTLDRVLYYLHNNDDSAIESYNKNASRMIDGKLLLIDAKQTLSERLLRDFNLDTQNLWGGEYILSSIQIGWLLADTKTKSFAEKVKELKRYHCNEIVQRQWKRISIKEILECKSIKSFAVLLLKMNMCGFTEFILCAMKKIGKVKF